MLEKYGFVKKFKEKEKAPTVVVGMSGGVDSSVAAFVCKWLGYNTIGLFMKNWEEKNNDQCCAVDDFEDVKRVAEVIGIPYYSVNFVREYKERVFDEFLRGLEQGITPNPDVLCNREIKFDAFLKHALALGAEFVATGHYARVVAVGGEYHLLKGLDNNKDQSYFLCNVTQEQFSRIMFSIGHLCKDVVRQIAAEAGLITADKPDSTGICFVGERKFAEFLGGFLKDKEGEIKTVDGRVVGRHRGLVYYTLGQRKGLGIGGMSGEVDNRWYVVEKNMETNTLVVSNGEGEELFSSELVARNFNAIGTVGTKFDCMAKVRYRQDDQGCSVEVLGDGLRVVFEKPQRAVTPGQWVVLYDGERCLGGAQIQSTSPIK